MLQIRHCDCIFIFIKLSPVYDSQKPGDSSVRTGRGLGKAGAHLQGLSQVSHIVSLCHPETGTLIVYHSFPQLKWSGTVSTIGAGQTFGHLLSLMSIFYLYNRKRYISSIPEVWFLPIHQVICAHTYLSVLFLKKRK